MVSYSAVNGAQDNQVSAADACIDKEGMRK